MSNCQLIVMKEMSNASSLQKVVCIHASSSVKHVCCFQGGVENDEKKWKWNPKSSFFAFYTNCICAWAYLRLLYKMRLRGMDQKLEISPRHVIESSRWFSFYVGNIQENKLWCFDIYILVFRFLIDADDSETTSLFTPHNKVAVNESFCRHVFHLIESTFIHPHTSQVTIQMYL